VDEAADAETVQQQNCQQRYCEAVLRRTLILRGQQPSLAGRCGAVMEVFSPFWLEQPEQVLVAVACSAMKLALFYSW